MRLEVDHMVQEAGKPAVYDGSLVELLNNAGIAVAGVDMQGSFLAMMFKQFNTTAGMPLSFAVCRLRTLPGLALLCGEIPGLR